MDKKLLIFFGPPGSGKTTIAREFAKKMGCPICDGDDYNDFHMRAAEQKKLTQEEKDTMCMDMHHKIIAAIRKYFESNDLVCVTDTLTVKKWQDLYTKEFGRIVNFIFVKPNQKIHLDRLFEREIKDPSNTNRDPAELRDVLENYHIKRANEAQEFLDSYITIENDFDAASTERAMLSLESHIAKKP